MTDFELAFVTDDVSDAKLDRLADFVDPIVDEHVGTTTIVLLAPGFSAVIAAKEAVESFEQAGITVHRTLQDLVTRSDIAQRCGVTPQAIGQWFRGQRFSDTPFPRPLHPVAGGIWLWGEVNDWLRSVGKEHDDVGYPSVDDHIAIDHWIARRRIASPSRGWTRHSRAHVAVPLRISADPVPLVWRKTNLVASGGR